MNSKERNECRDKILDVIEALRTNVPEVSFDVKAIQFSKDNYHIEVIASKKFKAGYGYRVKRDQELFAQNTSKLMLSPRIFNMAKSLGVKQIEELHKEYINDLA